MQKGIENNTVAPSGRELWKERSVSKLYEVLLLLFGAQPRSSQLFCRVIVHTNLTGKPTE